MSAAEDPQTQQQHGPRRTNVEKRALGAKNGLSFVQTRIKLQNVSLFHPLSVVVYTNGFVSQWSPADVGDSRTDCQKDEGLFFEIHHVSYEDFLCIIFTSYPVGCNLLPTDMRPKKGIGLVVQYAAGTE